MFIYPIRIIERSLKLELTSLNISRKKLSASKNIFLFSAQLEIGLIFVSKRKISNFQIRKPLRRIIKLFFARFQNKFSIYVLAWCPDRTGLDYPALSCQFKFLSLDLIMQRISGNRFTLLQFLTSHEPVQPKLL